MAFSSLFFLLLILPTSLSLPFVFFHGILDTCSTDKSIHLVSHLKNVTGVEGECIEIGNNGCMDSVTMPILEQIQTACDKVKESPLLKDGFNLIGLSQGGLIARGVIEFCDGAPPVNNLITIATPHAGVAALPACETVFGDNCPIAQLFFDKMVYTDFIQDHITPASYYKRPTMIEKYLKQSRLLPKLNNERPDERNHTYKDRFSSLNKLVLIMNEEDQVVNPKESAWFAFFKDGSLTDLLPTEQTELYIEDWIGLKILNETKRVIYDVAGGGHTSITDEELDKLVAPYLVDEIKTFNYDHRTFKLLSNEA